MHTNTHFYRLSSNQRASNFKRRAL